MKNRAMTPSKLARGSSPHNIWIDRTERYPLRLDVLVERPDASKQPAVLTNLSLEGCCVTGPFRVGERVSLTIPGMGPRSALVCWATYGRAGVGFIRERMEPLS
jgi:hypothetical protein